MATRSKELLKLEERARELRKTTTIRTHEPKDTSGLSMKDFLDLIETEPGVPITRTRRQPNKD